MLSEPALPIVVPVVSELAALAAVPVEDEAGHSNPYSVLRELLAPTFPDDDVDMCWQQSIITPPVIIDHAPSNSHGLAYIPDADADMCIQPIEDPLPSGYNPWNIEWSDEEDTIDIFFRYAFYIYEM